MSAMFDGGGKEWGDDGRESAIELVWDEVWAWALSCWEVNCCVSDVLLRDR